MLEMWSISRRLMFRVGSRGEAFVSFDASKRFMLRTALRLWVQTKFHSGFEGSNTYRSGSGERREKCV